MLLISTLLVVFGCSQSDNFHIKDFAKTNIDKVAEIHLEQVTTLLKQLTVKLYKKNPYELQKAAGQTIESRLAQIFICPSSADYAELQFKEGTDAILLGFDPEFEGDRVFALMTGLYTMIHQSYSGKCEFFVLDTLNEQGLYNSARNIEILVWRLKTRLNPDGSPIVLTNSIDGPNSNLSYERLFGKLISLQDTMAQIISNRTGRMIKEVVQIAGMAFLPIGL